MDLCLPIRTPLPRREDSRSATPVAISSATHIALISTWRCSNTSPLPREWGWNSEQRLLTCSITPNGDPSQATPGLRHPMSVRRITHSIRATHSCARLPLITLAYTHLRAHETPEHLVCRLLLEKKKKKN